MPEWYLVVLWLAILSALGLLWRPLVLTTPILLAAVGLSLVHAMTGAARASFANTPRSRLPLFGMRGLTAWLYLLQPLARLSGRLRAGLTPWRLHVKCAPSLRHPQRFRFWSERWREPVTILRIVEGVLRAHGAVLKRGGDFDPWDLHFRTGLFGGGRLLMAVEEHGSGKQLIRFRMWPWCSGGGLAVGLALALLATAAAFDGAWVVSVLLGSMALWPMARTALECGMAMSVVRHSLKQLWLTETF